MPKNSQIKVLFDHQAFVHQRYGGISKSFYELMNTFRQDDEVDFRITLNFSNNHYIADADFAPHRVFIPNAEFKGKFRIMSQLNKLQAAREIVKRDSYDIFHPTYFEPYFLEYIGKKPFLIDIHDMIYEIFPDLFSKSDKAPNWKKRISLSCDKIIAKSENTKQDIMKFFNLPESMISVIYHGAPDDATNYDFPPPAEKYLLYIGNRQLIYKNFTFFIRSVARLFREDRKLYMVCAGGGDFSQNELDLFKELGIEKKVIYQAIEGNNLFSLYHYADAFVFPSLYEGFGMPVLEAFKYECPIVLSNSSSFPEIARDAALYFDPEEECDILDNVREVLYNSTLKNELRIRGTKRVNEFSWDKTAEQTKAVYKEVLGV